MAARSTRRSPTARTTPRTSTPSTPARTTCPRRIRARQLRRLGLRGEPAPTRPRRLARQRQLRLGGDRRRGRLHLHQHPQPGLDRAEEALGRHGRQRDDQDRHLGRRQPGRLGAGRTGGRTTDRTPSTPARTTSSETDPGSNYTSALACTEQRHGRHPGGKQLRRSVGNGRRRRLHLHQHAQPGLDRAEEALGRDGWQRDDQDRHHGRRQRGRLGRWPTARTPPRTELGRHRHVLRVRDRSGPVRHEPRLRRQRRPTRHPGLGRRQQRGRRDLRLGDRVHLHQHAQPGLDRAEEALGRAPRAT